MPGSIVFFKAFYYIYVVECVHVCACMSSAWCVEEVRGALSGVSSHVGPRDGTRVIRHGGKHLHPLSCLTISNDTDFCLETFSVLKQERHKGAGTLLLFSHVTFQMSRIRTHGHGFRPLSVPSVTETAFNHWGKGIDLGNKSFRRPTMFNRIHFGLWLYSPQKVHLVN